MKKNLGFVISALVLGLSLMGCPDSKQRDLENYGDLPNQPGGIALNSPEQHVGGWGRRDCLLCHNAAFILHRYPGGQIDAIQLNQLIRANRYSQYCLGCHGPNGVAP